MSYKISSNLWDKIRHFASFQQTGGALLANEGLSYRDPGLTVCSLVSLQQMVLFGQNPSQGTLLRASQFLLGAYSTPLVSSLIRLTTLATLPTEELPVRLAHRVKELDELPHNLSAMPSINKVKDWYAQSFEVPLFVHHPLASLRI